MGLADDLLEQAEHLLKREPKRPRQASLRRAVSAAYYALFHQLCADASAQIIPAKQRALRAIVQRGLVHSELKNTCADFSSAHKPSVSPQIRALLTIPLEPQLCDLAKVFVDLQELRHVADYDVARVWNRQAAASAVLKAHSALTGWKTIRNSSNATIFLSCLLFRNASRR